MLFSKNLGKKLYKDLHWDKGISQRL